MTRKPSDHVEDDAPETSDAAPLGANLRKSRTRRGFSLERLSATSGVSRAMISQIERGDSSPTINVLWKLSRALGLTFSELIGSGPRRGTSVLRASSSTPLRSKDGSFSSRALFTPGAGRRVEFYELRLQGGGIETAEAHVPGTHENLTVADGRVEIEIGGVTHLLETGDAIVFVADVPHTYRNPDQREAVMYLVMSYGERLV